MRTGCLRTWGNKVFEYEYSAWGSVSCSREACFSTAGTRKFACRGMGQHFTETGPEDFPGSGNRTGVRCPCGVSFMS